MTDAIEEMLMIDPPAPVASHCRIAACDANSTPERSTSSTWSQLVRRDAANRLDDVNSGVVHQHIEATELCDCMLNQEVAAFGIGCVESSGHRLAAIRVDGIRSSSHAILVDVGDHYLRAVSGQPSRERLAKAARGSGDDCDATRQIEQCWCHSVSFSSRAQAI